MEKTYKENYYPEYFFIASAIFFALAIIGAFFDGAIFGFMFFITLIVLGYGIYFSLKHRTCTIDNKIIIKEKLITSHEFIDNFANCIEYDIVKEKKLLDVLFKQTTVKFIVKIRRGINDVRIDPFSMLLEDTDVDSFIKDVSTFLDSVKVRI